MADMESSTHAMIADWLKNCGIEAGVQRIENPVSDDECNIYKLTLVRGQEAAEFVGEWGIAKVPDEIDMLAQIRLDMDAVETYGNPYEWLAANDPDAVGYDPELDIFYSDDVIDMIVATEAWQMMQAERQLLKTFLNEAEWAGFILTGEC